MTAQQERPEPPVMPDFSREDRLWNRIIFTSLFVIGGVLLVALAIPHLRDRF